MSRTRAPRASRPALSLACVALALAAQALAPVALRAHPGMHETIALLTQRIFEAPNEQSLYLERGIAYSSDGMSDGN